MTKEELRAFNKWWYGLSGNGDLTHIEKIPLCKEGRTAKLAFKKGIEYQERKQEEECKCKETQQKS